ncbi:MAG: hypothetical protein V5B35_03735 [Candidatus Accumulibacter necessarius]|jgi:hypothetical protein
MLTICCTTTPKSSLRREFAAGELCFDAAKKKATSTGLFPGSSASPLGRWQPVAQKTVNDCFQFDPAGDARPRRFPIELAVPGPQAATELSWLAVGNRTQRRPSRFEKQTVNV